MRDKLLSAIARLSLPLYACLVFAGCKAMGWTDLSWWWMVVPFIFVGMAFLLFVCIALTFLE